MTRHDLTRPDDLIEGLIDGLVELRLDADGVVELGRRADADPEVRHRLDQALTSHRLVRRGVDRAVAVAADVDLPELAPTGASPGARSRLRARPRHLGAAWSGWLVAAVLAIVAAAAIGTRPAPTAPETARPRLVETTATDPALVRELPRLTLEVRPRPDGRGVEVVYLRRVVERAIVEDVYRLGHDEHGRPVVLPATASASASRQTL